MEVESITFDRAELYEAVWKRPVLHLAGEWGLSGPGLAKICKRLRVPLPDRGYWQKVPVGKAPPRPPLPALLSGQADQHVHRRRVDPDADGLSPKAKARIQVEMAPERVIDVRPARKRPHRAITLAMPVIKRNAKAPHHRDAELTCLDIRVTNKTLPRALRIADTLLKECEARGWSVEIPKDQDYSRGWSVPRSEQLDHVCCSLVRDEEELRFRIDEQYEVVNPVPKHLRTRDYLEKWQLEEKYGRPERRYTGKLSLWLQGLLSTDTQAWHDNQNLHVEECLNAFLAAAVHCVEVGRIRRARWRREADERRKQEKLEEEARRREEYNAELVTDLDQRLASWNRALSIRELVKRIATKRKGVKADAEWLAWARDQANEAEGAAVAELPSVTPA